MTIQRRLTLFTLLVVVLTTGSAGLFLIQSSYQNKLENVKTELASIIKTVEESDSDKASLALALVNSSQTKFSLFLADDKNELIPLLDFGEDAQQLKAVKNYLKNAKTFDDPYISVHKVAIEGDLSLVVSTSVKFIHDARNSEFIKFLFYLLLASIFALIILQRIISQDVKRESAELRLQEKLNFEQSRRKMLLEFASDTSHELRTPLTVITGYLELVKLRKNGHLDEETLSKLSQETTRLDQNISNLLTMLELEAIADESLHPINLSQVLREELEIYQSIELRRDFTIEIIEEAWINGSEELLLKLVRNILTNIRRHTPADSPVVARLRIIASTVVLTIEDGGPLRDSPSFNISDYLTRFNSSRSMSKGGSGLGFSIMNKSVERLSGTLELFASTMGGFGVRVQIPITNKPKEK
jgi:two-component system OmpR family sensor kinase